MLELSEILSVEDEHNGRYGRAIGARMSGSKEWLDFLDKHENNPEVADHVARLRQAIRLYGNTEE